jgi:hypothetical protein
MSGLQHICRLHDMSAFFWEESSLILEAVQEAKIPIRN